MDKATPTPSPASVYSVMALLGSMRTAAMRAYVDADRASSGAAQAVRMLTDADCREYLNGSWLTKDQDDAIAAFCAVNAGRTIPADGVIGGV